MKLKQTPSDFLVEELTDATPAPAGEFAFYRLTKVGWTTPDALAQIRRRWKIDARRLDYGGLKDRHAETVQYFTIYRGPEKSLDADRVQVAYLGRRPEPYRAGDIRANRFALTLRGLSPAGRAGAEASLAELPAAGVPNYFDDQRFGSVGFDGEFVGKALVLGDFEKALKLALAAPYEHDRAADKQEKQTLRDRWGDWPAAKAELPRGHARSLVDYLVSHPTDFKGAVARLRPELGGLYLSAYQSELWNRTLSRWIDRLVAPESRGAIRLKTGRVSVPLTVAPEVAESWRSAILPLPSSRLKPAPGAPWLPALEEVLAEEGMTLPKLKVPGLDKPFFSKGERPAFLAPAGLAWEGGADEINAGRQKLTLRFELPRGAYATMVVKRITALEPPTGR